MVMLVINSTTHFVDGLVLKTCSHMFCGFALSWRACIMSSGRDTKMGCGKMYHFHLPRNAEIRWYNVTHHESHTKIDFVRVFQMWTWQVIEKIQNLLPPLLGLGFWFCYDSTIKHRAYIVDNKFGKNEPSVVLENSLWFRIWFTRFGYPGVWFRKLGIVFTQRIIEMVFHMVMKEFLPIFTMGQAKGTGKSYLKITTPKNHHWWTWAAKPKRLHQDFRSSWNRSWLNWPKSDGSL